MIGFTKNWIKIFMKIFIITFIIFVCFILFASIGYIVSRKKISGSCGGLNSDMLGENNVCQVCNKEIDPKTFENIKNFDCDDKNK